MPSSCSAPTSRRSSNRAPAANQRLIGQQLVKLGYLAEPDLKSCLTRQSSELIYEILRWRHGRFRFAAGLELPPSVIDAALGLDVEAVLMEGYRRVDEWHLIERAIDNFDVVFLRNEDSVAQMGRGRLTREELAVLELVNGKNTVKDIIRKSRMGSVRGIEDAVPPAEHQARSPARPARRGLAHGLFTSATSTFGPAPFSPVPFQIWRLSSV